MKECKGRRRLNKYRIEEIDDTGLAKDYLRWLNPRDLIPSRPVEDQVAQNDAYLSYSKGLDDEDAIDTDDMILTDHYSQWLERRDSIDLIRVEQIMNDIAYVVIKFHSWFILHKLVIFIFQKSQKPDRQAIASLARELLAEVPLLLRDHADGFISDIEGADIGLGPLPEE